MRQGDDTIINILFSVFDFRLGPTPLLVYPEYLNMDHLHEISLSGQITAHKLAEHNYSLDGIFLPFENLKLVGYVYLFNVETDLNYSKEQTLGSLTFIVDEQYEIPFFSLTAELNLIAFALSSDITMKVKYNGEKTSLIEIEPIIRSNQQKLDLRFSKRVKQLDYSSYEKDLHVKFYYFITQTQKDLDKLLYGLIADPNQKILIYSSNEKNLLNVLECMQFLAPHRLIDIKIIGKEEKEKNSVVTATTNIQFAKAIEKKFDIYIDLDTGIINGKKNKSKFIKEISEMLINNRNVPELFNQVLNWRIKTELLGTVGKLIRVAGSLNDIDREKEFKKIINEHDKAVIEIAVPLSIYYNRFLGFYKLV